MKHGHASREMLRMMQREGHIKGTEYFDEAAMPACSSCDSAAAHRKGKLSHKDTLSNGRRWNHTHVHRSHEFPATFT